MLERLGEIIRGKGQGGQMPEHFAVSNDMMSVLGCGEDDIAQVLRSLGFRDAKGKNEAGEESVQWSQRLRRHERAPRPQRKRPEHHQGKRAQPAIAVPYGAPAGPAEAQPPEPRAERQDRHRHKDKDRKPRRDDERPPRQGKPAGKPYKEREPDPDSPFAVLAALKLRK
jgi:ATP-dependent RNA helicase SUPV3L1/SUV3